MSSPPPNPTQTYALLGATGQVGRSILTILLRNPSNHINVLIRSRHKLETINPTPAQSSRLTIFETPTITSPTAIPTLATCISNTRAVFLAVATNHNQPLCHIAQSTATAVIAALTLLKSQSLPLPQRLIILSSAETSPHLCADIPSPIQTLLYAANSHLYTDLLAAEAYLRTHADLIPSTFVKPGGLSHDVQTGHALSADRQQTFISYLDLAAGMVEVAEAVGGEWDMRSVSVLARGRARPAWENVPGLLKGLLVHLLPGLYGWLF